MQASLSLRWSTKQSYELADLLLYDFTAAQIDSFIGVISNHIIKQSHKICKLQIIVR